MPVNPTNKDAKDRLKTEKQITNEQSKQKSIASDFRNIQNEIKDSIHNMTLSQQTFFRSTVGSKDVVQQINKQLKLASTATKSEADARNNIVGMMKDSLKLGAESLTDMSKHEELSQMIAKAEQEKIRITSQFRGRNLQVGQDLQNNLDLLISQLNVSKEYALEQKRIQELSSSGTNMLMGMFDSLKGKIESMPGGDVISKALQLDVIGNDLKNQIGDNLKTMLDPKNMDPDKFVKGFQNIGKAGTSAFGEIGKAMWKVMAQIASTGIGAVIIAISVAVVALAAATSAAVSRFKELDKAAEDFRKETGMMNSQTEGLDNVLLAVNENYSSMGVTIEQAGGAAKALHEEFGRMKEISEDTVGAIALMSANFGIAEKDSAGAMRNIMNMSGVSSEVALNLQAGAIHLSEAAGVAPAEVMADIAKSAGAASKYFGGNTKEMIKTAIYARRLGLEMSDMTNMADNLLDFENSIQSQMEASVLLGRQLNFDKARQLALEGDLKGAADEVLKQVGTAADFNKLNVIQKKAVAKAAGLEVAQLEQALIRKEEMAMLSREEKMEIARREKLLGNLNKKTRENVLMQKEMQGLGQMMSAFWGKISEMLGSMLLPTIQKISGWMADILEDTEGTGGFFKFIQNILNPIAATLSLMVSFIFRFFQAAMTMGKPVMKFIGGITDALKSLGQLLIGIFTADFDLIKSAFSGFVGGIKDAFMAIPEFIASIFKGIWNLVVNIFSDIVDFIGNIFGVENLGTTVLNALKWPFEKVWDIVTWPFKMVWSFLKSIPVIGKLFGGNDGGNTGGFLSILKKPFQMVWDIITWPFEMVWSFLKKIPLIGRLFKGGDDGNEGGFVSALTAPFKMVWNVITWPFRKVWDFLKSIPVIGRLFGGSDSGDGGGIIDTITGAFSGVWDAITWPFRKVWDWLKSIPIIGRLFGGSNDGEGGGGITGIIGGALSGIAGLAGSALGAIGDVAGAAWDGVKNLGSSIVGGAKKLATGAWEGIKNVGSGLKNAASSAWGAVKGFFGGGKEMAAEVMESLPFTDIGSKLGGVVQGLGGKVSEMMSSSFTGEKFNGMLSTVQDGVGNVMESLSAINPMKAVGGALSDAWSWLTGTGGDEGDAAEPKSPDQLNKEILDRLDMLIAAVRESGGGDIVLDGKKVGKQIANASTSPVKG